MSVSHYEPALHRVLWQLRAYLDAVMVIGGWVPYCGGSCAQSPEG